MNLSAIYIDDHGESHILEDPANPGTIPKAVMELLKKYKICKIEFDKEHSAGDTAAELKKRIDKFQTENKKKLDDKIRLEKELREIEERYKKDAEALKTTEKKSQDTCDETQRKTDAAINRGDAPYANLNDTDKTAAHRKAKTAHDDCYKVAAAIRTTSEKALALKKAADPEIINKTVALNAISIDLVPLSCKVDVCEHECRLCVIFFLNKEEIDFKEYEPLRLLISGHLYFCRCTDFPKERYKVKDGKIIEQIKAEPEEKEHEEKEREKK